MPRYACPICGDPRAYPIWLADEPPIGCPNEPNLKPGRGPCAFQIHDAQRAALWRRVAPEAFDDMGNILPGGLAMVLNKLVPAAPRAEGLGDA